MHLADAKKGEGESLQSLWDRELLTDLIGQERWRLFDQSHAEATPNLMYVV